MFDIFNMLKKEDHKEAKQVTRDTIIGDILRRETDAAAFFREAGMHCIECPAARGETVAEACAVHGMDAEQFAAAFNARFATK